MSATVRGSRHAHLRWLGCIAGALFGVVGVTLPFAIFGLVAVLTGVTAFESPQWIGMLLSLAPLVLGAALSVLWLRAVGVPHPGRATAAAGAIAAAGGWVGMLALTPLLALLGVFGVMMADTEAMSLLPALAAVTGAIVGTLVWAPIARAAGGGLQPLPAA